MTTTPGATNVQRLMARLEALSAIGGGEGANRLGLGPEEQLACELVAEWMRAAALEVSWDPAGNLVGRLGGKRPELAEVWTGSHLDSVPRGGRFDGALGVVAGLEAVERVRDEPLERTLAVIAFRDEEGARFGRGTFGSRALCGQLDPGELEAQDRDGTRIVEALAELRLGPPPPGGWLDPLPAAFVEVHIEQGPVLQRRGAPLGLVTAIVAMARFAREFRGSAGHAGTTPMAARDDALCRAAEYVLRVRDAAEGVGGAVATVGVLDVRPGAVNVIPESVRLTVDVRAPDRTRLDAVLDSLDAADVPRRDDVPMSGAPLAALREAVVRCGAPLVELPSGAGHDAAILASAGVPTAMLFVRSLAGGVSHSPRESSSVADISVAVDVLTETLRALSAR